MYQKSTDGPITGLIALPFKQENASSSLVRPTNKEECMKTFSEFINENMCKYTATHPSGREHTFNFHDDATDDQVRRRVLDIHTGFRGGDPKQIKIRRA